MRKKICNDFTTDKDEWKPFVMLLFPFKFIEPYFAIYIFVDEILPLSMKLMLFLLDNTENEKQFIMLKRKIKSVDWCGLYLVAPIQATQPCVRNHVY